MAADPKGLDYTIGGEPLPFLVGKGSTTGFDYTTGGEPYPPLIEVEETPAPTFPKQQAGFWFPV